MRNIMMNKSTVIHRYPVQSSLFISVGYCPYTCIFDIELKDGSVYRYYGVPALTCWNLLCADSKGRYFNQHIKSAFTYQRISPPRCSFEGRPPQPRSRWASRCG
jgi:hypothetical protein